MCVCVCSRARASAYIKIKNKNKIAEEEKKKKENDRNDVIDNGNTVGFHFDYIRHRQMVGNRTTVSDDIGGQSKEETDKNTRSVAASAVAAGKNGP